MSGSQNANATLVEVRSEGTVGVRKAAQVLAATVLAALFAIPVASAVETTLPWQPVQTKQAVHAFVVRGQALNRIYHLGSYARTSPAKVKASTVLRPTAVKIAANRTGGSMNKVQQVFSIH